MTRLSSCRYTLRVEGISIVLQDAANILGATSKTALITVVTRNRISPRKDTRKRRKPATECDFEFRAHCDRHDLDYVGCCRCAIWQKQIDECTETYLAELTELIQRLSSLSKWNMFRKNKVG